MELLQHPAGAGMVPGCPRHTAQPTQSRGLSEDGLLQVKGPFDVGTFMIRTGVFLGYYTLFI